ncbi:MAG: TonB-dependent receptor, partial [Gammaproteobacteria bacterium]|nr:TonB-dependent receptor [Gammaproteobacteria bacterium]
AGGTALTEEKSLNISAGFSADIGDYITLTADIYKIEVDDRIYRTGDIPVPPQPGDDPNLPARSISFYTNALDVEHEGVDIVATSSFDLGAASSLDLALAYGYNKVDVTGQKLVAGIQPVNDGLVEDIENNYPEHRWTLTGNWLIGEQFNIMGRVNFYGEHFDERGRIGVGDGESAKIDSTIYVDLEAGWQFNENVRVVLGGSNIFDEFIDTIGPPNANRLSVGLQYPRRTVANYEGGSWYLKGIYSW